MTALPGPDADLACGARAAPFDQLRHRHPHGPRRAAVQEGRQLPRRRTPELDAVPGQRGQPRLDHAAQGRALPGDHRHIAGRGPAQLARGGGTGGGLIPGAGIGDAVREGWRINLPERRTTGAGEVTPLVTVDRDAVVITAVKLADDGSGDVVVRLHEAHGGRARATLTAGFEVADVTATDLLERPLPETPERDGNRVPLRLRPFQLVTLRLRRAESEA